MNNQLQPINERPVIHAEYHPVPLQDVSLNDHVLAAFGFDGPCAAADNPRHISTGLAPLTGEPVSEVWFSNSVVHSGVDAGVSWSRNDHLLLAALWFDDDGHSFTEASFRAYRQLLGFVGERGFRHLLRSWNYLRDINHGDGDEERYKLFCAGRHQAFKDLGYSLSALPSACALGHHDGANVAYVLAGLHPGRHFENPQQTSAYHYPREYGFRSPSFARATVAPQDLGNTLFLSGTASIRGHETHYPHQIEGQIDVTLSNIDSLLAHVNKELAQPGAIPEVLKVYIRNQDDLEPCRQVVSEHFGAETPIIYLQAEICRRDLLVEVDGVFVLE